MDQPYRRITVRGLAVLDGRVLAVQHATTDGSPAPYWALPGGGLDAGERLEQGLVRELIEDTGITPRLGTLLYIQQFSSPRGRQHGAPEQLEFIYHITNPQDYLHVDLSTTTHGQHELSRCEFIDPHTHTLLPDFLRTDPLPTAGSTVPVRVISYL